METDYLTVPEVAARLRVTEERVRRWLRAGDLRGVRFAKRTGWRVTEADLADFLRGRENRPDRSHTTPAPTIAETGPTS